MKVNRSVIQILPLCVTLLMLPLMVQAQFNFTTNSDGTLNITGYTGSPPNTLVIPDSIVIDGFEILVSSIGDRAFADYYSLTNIFIGANVTSIGSYAFNTCFNVLDVTIPEVNTNIGSYAFQDCLSLTHVKIPGGSIGYRAFQHCSGLNSITLSPNVNSIGSESFSQCALTSVIVPHGNISYGAFAYCTGLTNATIGDGVTILGDGAVFLAEEGVFYNCSHLTTVAIGTNISIIGQGSFANCGLTSLIIPNNVQQIGTEAFMGCTGLTNITIGTGITTIYDYAFADCFNLKSVTIPSGTIGYGAFSQCSNLNSVVIGNGVTCIGFANLSALEEFFSYFIGGAFSGCSKLTSITIPNSVNKIGNGAFAGCLGLTNITIPYSVRLLAYNAFFGCDNLHSVFFQGDAPEIIADGFTYQDAKDVFSNSNSPTGLDPAIVYYLPGTTGWSSIYAGLPTDYWLLPTPLALYYEPSFGVQSNEFGFVVSWATNMAVVLELQACTNLVNPTWLPIGTNALSDGWAHFSDPQWTNYSNRFYRLLMQQ
jgi:hypothetical protein